MNRGELEQFRTEWRQEVAKKSKKTDAMIKNDDIREHEKSANKSNEISRIDPASFEPTILLQSGPSKITSAAETFGDASTSSISQKHEEAKPFTALQVYQGGVEKERRGLLSDALVLYRRAFRMDPDVEESFRIALRKGEIKGSQDEDSSSFLEDQDYAKFVQTGHDYDPDLIVGESTEFEQLTQLFALLRMPISAGEPPDEASIALLPEEILQQILLHAIVSDGAVCFTALSMTCQKFFVLLHDEKIWQTLCVTTYRDQVYSEGTPFSADSEDANYVQELVREVNARYEDSWKKMFIEKPRIRMNGVYIATCHYTRPGVREESLDWTNPVLLVTYFRYLRFFATGECLSLLTTSEPREIVHQLTKNTKLKGVQHGKWSMTRKGQLSIELVANYSFFFMELQIKSSSRGRHNKLRFTRFYGVHPQSAEVTNFNLKNDRSFFFSKVRSYDVTTGKSR